MIKDELKYANNYFKISERIRTGLQWLQNNDLNKMKDGKYYIDSDNIYVNIQTYLTKDTALYEAHREYIDIQYMIKGVELVGVTDYSKCDKAIEYEASKDIEFLNFGHDEEYQLLKENNFLILFPNDAHKPSMKYNSNQEVKKAVVKVKIK